MESKIYRIVKNKYQGEYEYHFKLLRDMLKSSSDESNLMSIDHELKYLAELKMKIDILDSASVTTHADQKLLFG